MSHPNLSTPAVATDNAQADLLNALSALRVSGRYADLTITCNYRQWAVHKAIVCSRSSFFDGACSSGLLEATSGIIDLSEDDEDAVEQMIQFFYYLDYLTAPDKPHATVFRHRARAQTRHRRAARLDLSQIEDPLLAQAGCFVRKGPERHPPGLPPRGHKSINATTGKHSSSQDHSAHSPIDSGQEDDSETQGEEDDLGIESHLILHSRVYSLAEKYEIPPLKQLAKTKFEISMACFYDSPEFAEAIQEVYCSTVDSDRGLRNIVLEAFKSHPELASTQDVYETIKDTPSLAMDLFKIERGIPV